MSFYDQLKSHIYGRDYMLIKPYIPTHPEIKLINPTSVSRHENSRSNHSAQRKTRTSFSIAQDSSSYDDSYC